MGETGLLERVLQIPKLVVRSADSKTPEIAPVASRGRGTIQIHPAKSRKDSRCMHAYVSKCWDSLCCSKENVLG